MIKHEINFFDLTSSKKDFLKDVLVPNEVHSANIIEIITGKEDLSACDGLITSNKNNFAMGVYTADCASICFYDNDKYGIIHVGWRGLVNGIIENMLAQFTEPFVSVYPFLKVFEIQKDDCYHKIVKRFGDKYFEIRGNRLFFHFDDAIYNLLPSNTKFDRRNTFSDANLASHRRDNKGESNYTIIYGLSVK